MSPAPFLALALAAHMPPAARCEPPTQWTAATAGQPQGDARDTGCPASPQRRPIQLAAR